MHSQEGEFGGGCVHETAAPGAVQKVPAAIQEHGIPGVVELPGKALPCLVAEALGVARDGQALDSRDPGGR